MARGQDDPVFPATEAAQHAGKTVTLKGRVASANISKTGGHLFLNLERKFPDEPCAVFVPKDRMADLGLDTSLMGKLITVRGEVRLVGGKARIEVRERGQVTVLEGEASPAAETSAPASGAEPSQGTPTAGAVEVRSFADVKPGREHRVLAPVPKEVKVPTLAGEVVVGVLVPDDFDAARAWPLLVLPSGADAQPRLRSFEGAAKQGWVVISAGTPSRPGYMTPEWSGAVIRSAMAAMRRDWAGSERWPLVVAGHAGGARAVCSVAAALARDGREFRGLFLNALADDALSRAFREMNAPDSFRNVPVVLGAAEGDTAANPERVGQVAESMRAAGFTDVTVLRRDGRAGVDANQLSEVLTRFRP